MADNASGCCQVQTPCCPNLLPSKLKGTINLQNSWGSMPEFELIMQQWTSKLFVIQDVVTLPIGFQCLPQMIVVVACAEESTDCSGLTISLVTGWYTCPPRSLVKPADDGCSCDELNATFTITPGDLWDPCCWSGSNGGDVWGTIEISKADG